jgi:hypothetical protein
MMSEMKKRRFFSEGKTEGKRANAACTPTTEPTGQPGERSPGKIKISWSFLVPACVPGCGPAKIMLTRRVGERRTAGVTRADAKPQTHRAA